MTAPGAPLPHPDALLRAMAALGVRGDPLLLLRDSPDALRRAELLAHLVAGTVAQLQRAERAADLSADDRVELHREADAAVTDGSGLVDLQLARLEWARDVTMHDREHPVAETVTTALTALVQLLAAWRDRPDGVAGSDPMLADALHQMRSASTQLTTVLRNSRYGSYAGGVQPKSGRTTR